MRIFENTNNIGINSNYDSSFDQVTYINDVSREQSLFFESLCNILTSNDSKPSVSYVLYEYYTNGFKDEFLLILSFISIILGILVIISKNPIVSVLFLIGLFMSISFYLMFLGLNFLGISYLLVYIGAVSILFLFILMLINVRVSELLSDTYNSIILSILITFYISTALNQTTYNNITGSEYIYSDKNVNTYNIEIFRLGNNNDVSYVSYESWDSNLTSVSYITSIGNVLYTNYSIWLILTSIILLLAMVGCIIITIRKK